MTMSDAEQRIVDGTAWAEFCDALKEAGTIIQNEKQPPVSARVVKLVDL